MAEVRKIATTIMVGEEIFQTNTVTLRIEDVFGEMMREMEMTRLHGPLLGPGRNELWQIEAPRRRRQRIREHAFAIMQGKHPRHFVRVH